MPSQQLSKKKDPPLPLTYESAIFNISRLHKTIKFGFSKPKAADKEELYDLLSEFYDDFCVVICEIPGNEKRKAYTEKELGFKIIAMPPKAKSGEDQNADYALKISINGEPFKRLNIRFERKEINDLNVTILNNWERFLAELELSKDEDFRIVVEGGMLRALTLFRAYPKKCKYCENVGYHINNNHRDYYCKFDKKERAFNDSCNKLILKTRSDAQVRQLIALKRKRIGIIEAMGFPVAWCDNRANAAIYIHTSVKQFFIVRYAEVLEL